MTEQQKARIIESARLTEVHLYSAYLRRFHKLPDASSVAKAEQASAQAFRIAQGAQS